MTGLMFSEPLHPDEETVLRAMRQRKGVSWWRAIDLSKQACLPYGRAWRALQRLHRRGYVRRDMLAHWQPQWDKVVWPHRAQVCLDTVDLETFTPPSWLQRFVERWGPYFGASWT